MRRRGSALVVTLAALAGLVALVGVLATGHGAAMQAQTNRMALRRARLAAESGIQRAISELQSSSPGAATLSDSWATLGNGGATSFDIGTDSARIQVVDCAGRINLNTADHDTLVKLPISADQADSLLDWREKTPAPRAAGAKDEYYNGLVKPYNTKLGALSSVDELLQIRGFTPSTVFGGTQSSLDSYVCVDSASNDLDPHGNPKMNIATATMDQLTSIGVPPQLANTLVQSQGSFSKMSNVLGVQGMDQATAKTLLNNTQVGSAKQTTGLVNVNTASAAVLGAIPGIDSDMASSIVDRQSSGFKGLGDLVDVPGFSISSLGKVVDRLAVSSRAFEIRSLGSAAGMSVGLTAVVSLDAKSNVTLVRIQGAPSNNPARLWGWPDQTSDRTTLTGVW